MTLIKFFLISHFLFLQPMAFASVPKAQIFNATSVARLNSHKNSHQLAKVILARPNIDPLLANEMKRFLKQDVFTLPVFTLKNSAINFIFEGKSYKWSRLKGSEYLLNGKKIDLESAEWKARFANVSAQNYLEKILINEADALAPLAWGLIWAGSLLVAGCLISNLPDVAGGSMGSSPIQYGKTLSAAQAKFNKHLGFLRSSFKAMGCAAHADEAFGETPDYYNFFADYCTSINSAVAASDNQIRQIVNPYRRQLTPDERTDIFIETVKDRYLNKAELCSQYCVAYDSAEMPELDKELIDQIMATPEFKKSCRAGDFAKTSKAEKETTETVPYQ